MDRAELEKLTDEQLYKLIDDDDGIRDEDISSGDGGFIVTKRGRAAWAYTESLDDEAGSRTGIEIDNASYFQLHVEYQRLEKALAEIYKISQEMETNGYSSVSKRGGQITDLIVGVLDKDYAMQLLGWVKPEITSDDT